VTIKLPRKMWRDWVELCRITRTGQQNVPLLMHSVEMKGSAGTGQNVPAQDICVRALLIKGRECLFLGGEGGGSSILNCNTR
jgi:hypothetical protein